MKKKDSLNKNTDNNENESSAQIDAENSQDYKDLNDNTNAELSENDKKNDEKNNEEELLEELENLKEEKIRLLAEMENLRKRFEREKIDLIKFGSLNLARDMLSPGDNLERALKSIAAKDEFPNSFKNLVEGIQMVQKEFESILKKNGIQKIESLNKKFDHNLHQAITEIEDLDVDEGTVIQEIQSGYIMHDRLLRPAMVGVSKKPTNQETSDNNENDETKSKQN